MAQASQALTLCRATAEFSGSTEQVEGEKLLLIASKHVSLYFIQSTSTCFNHTIYMFSYIYTAYT